MSAEWHADLRNALRALADGTGGTANENAFSGATRAALVVDFAEALEGMKFEETDFAAIAAKLPTSKDFGKAAVSMILAA